MSHYTSGPAGNVFAATGTPGAGMPIARPVVPAVRGMQGMGAVTVDWRPSPRGMTCPHCVPSYPTPFRRRAIPPGIKPAMGQADADGMSTGAMLYGAVTTASMAASAYHGYKRNRSIGWALAWGALGAMFPVVTPTIAVAQGFGKRKTGR